MTINRIRELRDNKKMSLPQFSEDLFKKVNLKISPDALSKYERGDREPKLETWQKLADYFGTTLDYLVGFETIEQKNCPYCHDLEETGYGLYIAEGPYEACQIKVSTNELVVWGDDAGFKKINFCPVCGRKLQ